MKILELIESIARERCIESSIVSNIMEGILLDYAKSKYGEHDALKAEIFPDGSFEVFLNQKVVEYRENGDFSSIVLAKAKLRDPNVEIGGYVKEVLPVTLGKSDVEKIFLTLRKKLNEAQKEREYEVFQDKIGINITGYIKRVDVSEAVITFPEGEGILRKADMLPNDILRAGNYIKVYVKDVRQGLGRQVFLSRTHEGFLRELLKQEVPEIQDGLVEIKAIARDAGSLSKVAVHAVRSSINPISVCIGAYGSRIQVVMKELLGEKISIVEWDADKLRFISNALSPAEVLKVTEVGENKYEVVTNQEQFSKAMGRGGQNVVLAKKLCQAASIKLLTEEEEARIYQEMVAKKVSDLVAQLEMEEMMAHLLISEKFDTALAIGKAKTEDIAKLNGFDEELAALLQERAKEYLSEELESIKNDLIKNGKDESLLELKEFLSNNQLKYLISKGICEKNDVAMLDAHELKEIFESELELNISFEKAYEIISFVRGIKNKLNTEIVND